MSASQDSKPRTNHAQAWHLVITIVTTVIMCLMAVTTYLNAPHKEVDTRIRLIENNVTEIKTDVEWIKRSQERVEMRVNARLGMIPSVFPPASPPPPSQSNL